MKWLAKLEVIVEAPDRKTAWRKLREICDREMPLADIISMESEPYTGNLVALNEGEVPKG